MTERHEVRIPIASFRRLSGAEPGQVEGLIRARLITVKDGQISLVQATRALIDHVRAEAKNSSLSAARNEAREARALASELELQIDERLLVDGEDADEALRHIALSASREFSIIPARTTREMKDRRTLENLLWLAQHLLSETLKEGAEDTPAKPRKTKRTRKGTTHHFPSAYPARSSRPASTGRLLPLRHRLALGGSS